MACPDLGLHIAAPATLSDVSSFLGIDLATARAFPRDVHQARERIGQLDVLWSQTPRLDYGDYAAAWNLIVEFRGSYAWWGIRFRLVLDLCHALYSSHGGTYLGLYDTGTVAFWLYDDRLWFPSENREYLSRFPIPFESYSFDQLAPV
jgi:hypothetical protein